jgi:prepilin-type N-terminal cleavage/methylation domain-containing protein
MKDGLTLVEVLVALLVLGVAVAILATALLGSVRQTDRFGARTQASDLLSYLGRQVTAGEVAALPFADAPLAWDYGELGGAFPELVGDGRADPGRYRAAIERVAAVVFAGAEAVQYRLTVCTRGATGESCVAGTTLGPDALDGGPASLLPGLN